MSGKKGSARKVNALETKIHKAALAAGRVRGLLLQIRVGSSWCFSASDPEGSRRTCTGTGVEDQCTQLPVVISTCLQYRRMLHSLNTWAGIA